VIRPDRSPRWGAAILLAVAAAGPAPACGPNHPPGGGPLAGDTARGVVEVVGAEPLTRVVLRSRAGDLPLTGAPAGTLRRASGVDVWVAGTRTADGSLDVHRFRVRSVDGQEAADGVLELEGGMAVLVTATGDRTRYSSVPAGLRPMEGQRVWIVGSPGGHPMAWGLLDPDP
jgi:hypothetical protein